MALRLPTSQSMSAYPSWQEIVAKYQNPDLRRSLWQIVNSFAPFLILWYLMYRSLEYSYWLTLVLALPTAGLLMRVFIILHDCGHGSFFKSQRASDMVGTVCGVLTFTPYLQWRHEHAIHHASSGDLARRGTGDVVTLTVKEYLALSWWEKLKYRVYRHPLVMFGIGPTIIFLFTHRFPSRVAGKRERLNLHLTNLGLLALFLVLGWAIGFKALLLVHGPIFLLSSTVGVWMFYVQHQFEDTYWKEHQAWDYVMAALQGSSFYRLPKLLQWFTGNIGLHHIHHLSPKIPNYNLQKAFDENPLLQQVTIVTLWESLRTIPLRLWDENQGRMVGFGHLKTLQSN